MLGQSYLPQVDKIEKDWKAEHQQRKPPKNTTQLLCMPGPPSSTVKVEGFKTARKRKYNTAILYSDLQLWGDFCSQKTSVRIMKNQFIHCQTHLFLKRLKINIQEAS